MSCDADEKSEHDNIREKHREFLQSNAICAVQITKCFVMRNAMIYQNMLEGDILEELNLMLKRNARNVRRLRIS